MNKISAGILVYRKINNNLEFLLVHPGGPFWAKKDEGIWSIPKGEINGNKEEQNNFLLAAKREFEEELGFNIEGDFRPLGSIVQKSGKTVYAWAIKGNPDISNIQSNTCKVEWPPRSKKIIEIPEVDKAEFFNFEIAKNKINPTQIDFLLKVIQIDETPEI